MTDWIPVDHCTLPSRQHPLRVKEFDNLFADDVGGVDRPSATELLFTMADRQGLDLTVDDLVSRESSCCSFFGFELRREDRVLILRVTVPPARADVLDGMASRASALMRGAAQHLPST